MELRKGEADSTVVRTDRFFKSQDYWYFNTREGVTIGPFDDRPSALSGCQQFIEYMAKIDPRIATTLQWYGDHAA